MPDLSSSVPWRLKATDVLRAVMEGLLLLLVCLSPWAFGGVHPGFEFLLLAGVGLLLSLWAAILLLGENRPMQFSAVAACLAGLLLLGLWQITPLSRPVLGLVSPGTANWYDRLLPALPEELPNGNSASERTTAGATISFDPAATRGEAVRLLAVFALFMLVRQNLCAPAVVRRLCLAATINGTLLALFALAQFWTARPGTVYWSIPTVGWAFGPFINHDHAATYFNLCLGLALGLFLDQSRRAESRLGRNWWFEPGVLWLLLALTILLIGVAFSLSRGGLLSFFGAAGLCLALQYAFGMRGRLTGILPVIVGLALLLLLWFGMGPLMERVNHALEHGDPSRIRAWSRVLPLSLDFPLWGTGYGTFGFVEQTQRSDAIDVGYVYSHAHNEYVEALAEGGFPRLFLSLAILFLVGRAALRVMRRKPHSLDADLAFGGLFALAALALQSFVEFGVHIPAIALLATVFCAQLCGLEGAIGATSTLDDNGRLDMPPNALTRIAMAAAILGVAFVLGAQGWKAYRVDLLQSSAQTGGADGDLSPEQIRRLELAARLAPDNASVHLTLAQAYLRIVEEQKKRIVRRLMVRETAQTVLAFAPLDEVAQAPLRLLTRIPGLLLAIEARERVLEDDAPLYRASLASALIHLIGARNANPLLPAPHLYLAAHAHELKRADSPLVYLDRAKLLSPGNPHLWYVCGLRDLALRHPKRACADWRHSLELSDKYLNDILKASAPLFPPDIIRTQILAAKPGQFLVAARALFPREEQQMERSLFLEQAVPLLEQQPVPRSAEDLHVEAEILAANHPDRAMKVYQLALGQQPNRVDWRWEFAQLLHKQARLSEARHELRTILQEQPNHAAARELWRSVDREITEKK